MNPNLEIMKKMDAKQIEYLNDCIRRENENWKQMVKTGEVDRIIKNSRAFWAQCKPPLQTQKKCTCGARACGFNSHSDWCDADK